MSNVKAELGYGHDVIDIQNLREVYDILYSILSVDNDLIENAEYFRKDTLELGYDNEAERLIIEALDKEGKLTSNKFLAVCNEILKPISSQDYFGQCELNIINISENKVSVLFIYGG